MLEFQHRPLRISLTPLIDVVFIMLLFFMLASTFTQWQQLPLSSIAKGKPRLSSSMPSQLFVLGEMKVRYKGKEYQLGNSGLQSLLFDFRDEGVHLLVTPESRATVQDVVLIMDHIVAAGLDNVSLTSSFDER